jgi:anti-anti-sigma factor
MMTKKKNNAEKKVAALALSGEMTIQRIAEIKKQLSEILAETNELALDLKDVNRADLTFLQLLCSAHRTAQSSGKKIHCSEVSEAVDQAISDAGFVRDNMGCGQDCTDSCLWMEEN